MYIYMYRTETNMWGMWTNPISLVKHIFRDDMGGDELELIKFNGQLMTPIALAAHLLEGDDPCRRIDKILVDPTDDRGVWTN